MLFALSEYAHYCFEYRDMYNSSVRRIHPCGSSQMTLSSPAFEALARSTNTATVKGPGTAHVTTLRPQYTACVFGTQPV